MMHETKMKIDINDMMHKSGIKWRRPFRPDPRMKEQMERTMRVPKMTYENPAPEQTNDGRKINAT